MSRRGYASTSVLRRTKIPRYRSARRSGFLRQLLERDLKPGLLVGALLVLVLATDIKFRQRDAVLANAGVIDLQIIGELVIWAVVGVWVLWHLGLRDVGLSRARRPAGAGSVPREPELRLLLLVGATILVGALYAPVRLSLVRGVQWAVLIGWVILAVRQIGGDQQRLSASWAWLRRLLWGSALLFIVASALLSFDWQGAPGGVQRYRWFTMHPIQTANGLGIALLALAGTYLALPDPLFDNPRWRWVRRFVLVLLTVLLALTRARGATIATALGIVTLVVLCPFRKKRAVALLVGLSLAALLGAGYGLSALAEFLSRGQTTGQLQELSGRGEIIRLAVELLGERPLFGYGYLAGRQIFLDLIVWTPGESHNVFVEIAISFGIFGLVVFGAFLARLAFRVLQGLRSPVYSSRLLMREAAALGVFVLASGMVAEGFIAPGYEAGILLWTVVACVCSAEAARATASRSATEVEPWARSRLRRP